MTKNLVLASSNQIRLVSSLILNISQKTFTVFDTLFNFTSNVIELTFLNQKL